jgi:hypothetical protein
MSLETLVGHLLVVGGRAVSVPPPGALTETAPRRAPRVREGDRFFILVTPADDTRAPAAFFEELARLAADTYFNSGGGVTGGLRESLTAIHARAKTDGPVNALALALRGEELYAARCGRTFAVLSQPAGLTFFPSDRHDPLVISTPPLGGSADPDIQLARYAVTPESAALLADPGLLDADDEALRTALSGNDARLILDRLKPLAASQAAASLVQFVTPGTVEVPAPQPSPSPSPPRRPSRPAAPAPGEAPVAHPAPPPPGAADSPAPADSAAKPEEEAKPARRRFGRLSVPKLPQRRGPSPLTTISLKIRRAVRDVARGFLGGVLGVTNFFTRLLNLVLPEPDEQGRQGIPTNVAVGLAILIPVVIVIVVVGLALSNRGRTDFEITLERAEDAHEEALALSGGSCDNPVLRPAWVEVLQLAEQAEKYRSTDTTVLQIKADAQNYLDCFDKVDRRNLTLLREFADNAELVGPIVNGGVDLYTLDQANGAIYHDTLNESGTNLTTRDSTPIVRRGQAVSALTVGDMFDIEWLTSGGTVHDNVLIAVDRSGVLVSYSPTFFASAQQLVVEGRWIDPIAIAVFRGNLYVLDRGASQIWRYVPPAGERRYSNAPEEYFIGFRPDLSGAVDLGISEDGAVFILFSDGSVSKYLRNAQGIAEEEPFDYGEMPPGAILSGSVLFVDNDPASRQLYIVDTMSETIYETSWAGRLDTGYRPRSPSNAFHDLSGIYADAVVRNNMYVVAGNKLYHFFRSE